MFRIPKSVLCAAVKLGSLTLAGRITIAHFDTNPKHSPLPPMYDVCIVGGGVVGVAIARACAIAGYSTLLLERENNLISGASSGNSGIGCTGYDAPKGSLERKLLRRAIQLHPAIYRSFGMTYQHVRKCGSLVIAWSPSELQALHEVLQDNIDAGDRDARLLSASELHQLEPSLSKQALGAVFLPREVVVEPWLVARGYAESAIRHGATIQCSTEVINTSYNTDTQCWILGTRHCNMQSVGRSEPNQLVVKSSYAERSNSIETRDGYGYVCAKVVINCAGLLGDILEGYKMNSSGSITPLPFHITPRKGQFLVYQPPQDVSHAPQYILERVPSDTTKGIIVWQSIYGNIIVGPTATPQSNRGDRSTDIATLQQLQSWAEYVCPSLRQAVVIGSYSGLRPASEYRDYQIYADQHVPWITVGGIRSTGLTASPAIAEYVLRLLQGMNGVTTSEESDLLGVTEAASSPVPLPPNAVDNDPMPSLSELARSYREQGNGCVSLYNKDLLVTHPLSSFGMESMQDDE